MKYGIHPAPVYAATFAGGETIRMSFWTAPKKPLDFDGARRMVCQVIGAERARAKSQQGVQESENASRRIAAVENLANRPGTEGERKAAKAAAKRLRSAYRNAPRIGSLPQNYGHEGAAWVCVNGKWRYEPTPAASDIVAGHVERKDAGHEGEIVQDPFFAPKAATVHRAKRAANRPAAAAADAELQAARANLERALERIALLEEAVAWERHLTKALVA